MTAYTLTLFAHILIVVYLLGADLGRAYLARRGAAAELGDEARRLAAHSVLWLGSATNLTLILMLPAGVTLGAILGVYRIAHPAWLIGTWAVAAIWFVLSLLADRSAATSDKKTLRVADAVFRVLIAPGFIYDGAIVFAGLSETVSTQWLASKIALYGVLILISIPQRWLGFSLRSALRGDDISEIRRCLQRLNLPIILGWIVILLAAWFGVAKPI